MEQGAVRRAADAHISELNAAAPDTPVMISHLYQSVLLNRAALRAAGYTRGTPEVPGGQIVRDHDGEPTGLLLAAPDDSIQERRWRMAPGRR